MDTLTLPEPGWALAYPSPHYDVAHLVHMPCAWRSDLFTPDWGDWGQTQVIERHKCTKGGGTR